MPPSFAPPNSTAGSPQEEPEDLDPLRHVRLFAGHEVRVQERLRKADDRVDRTTRLPDPCNAITWRSRGRRTGASPRSTHAGRRGLGRPKDPPVADARIRHDDLRPVGVGLDL